MYNTGLACMYACILRHTIHIASLGTSSLILACRLASHCTDWTVARSPSKPQAWHSYKPSSRRTTTWTCPGSLGLQDTVQGLRGLWCKVQGTSFESSRGCCRNGRCWSQGSFQLGCRIRYTWASGLDDFESHTCFLTFAVTHILLALLACLIRHNMLEPQHCWILG